MIILIYPRNSKKEMASLNQNGHFKNVQNEIPQNSFEIHYYQKGVHCIML